MDRLREAKARIARIWEDGAAALGIRNGAVERFLESVSVAPDRECWIWTGTKQSDGTGQFTCPKRNGERSENSRAHRLVYELKNKRKVPANIYVIQTCGDKLRVRPEHLMERPMAGRKRGHYKKSN